MVLETNCMYQYEGKLQVHEVQEVHYWGWVDKTIAVICNPLAIPSPRDVKQVVILDMESSNDLFDCSKDLTISFFIRRSSLAVFTNGWSRCPWDRVFSMCLLLLSTIFVMLETAAPLGFSSVDGSEVSLVWPGCIRWILSWWIWNQLFFYT